MTPTSSRADRLLRWKPHRWDWQEKHRIVWISVEALDASWQKDCCYVAAGGKGGNAFRYQRFGQWLRASNPRRRIQMPVVGFPGDCVGFEDGRHRFAWLRDHGVDALPVMTYLSDVDAIAATFGTSRRLSYVPHS
jgi:hypothetical protein